VIIDDVFEVVAHRNITLGKLADKIGYDRKSVYKWRAKERVPNMLVVDDLLDALDLKLVLKRKPRA